MYPLRSLGFVPGHGFPRTRGDVPPPPTRRLPRGRLPPHTRGCTGAEGGRGRRRGASPAHAGMYPRAAVGRGINRSFPRTRGDVPPSIVPPNRRSTLPPHTRGCTPRRRPASPRQCASPAHAGMYPPTSASVAASMRFPRTRGDVPRLAALAEDAKALPPHTRGCTSCAVDQVGPRRASPAHAGMYRISGYSRRPGRSFPRTRGDVPDLLAALLLVPALPPHTRGCTGREDNQDATQAASPAHAGMYPTIARAAGPACSFPRTRGDVPRFPKCQRKEDALPPHTRGCTIPARRVRRHRRASPAHAGMYPLPEAPCAGRGRFPRTRGDVPRGASASSRSVVLPPHTRGCTRRAPAAARRAAASPAHAGMYPASRGSRRHTPRFPRTRGDVPKRRWTPEDDAALPPHTRGCTCRTAQRSRWRPASPAHAGMYPPSKAPPPTPGRFPRTRGDVPAMSSSASGRSMLPPHTRGCTLRKNSGISCEKASPAHAGMYRRQCAR